MRTKGALGKKTLAKIAASGDLPVTDNKPVTRTVKATPIYIPYEKSKTDKNGQIITYQTYKVGNQWLIDIFTDGKITLKGIENSIVALPDAIRFIDADLARL